MLVDSSKVRSPIDVTPKEAKASKPQSSQGSAQQLGGLVIQETRREVNAQNQQGNTQGQQQVPQVNPAIPHQHLIPPNIKDGDAFPRELRESLFAQIRAIPVGAEILGAIEKAGRGDFPLKWSSAGSFHQAGSIFIRDSADPASWVLTIVHEMAHLRGMIEGKQGNVMQQGRADYVNTMMDDEINAQKETFLYLLQKGAKTGQTAGYYEFRAFLESQHASKLQQQDWTAIGQLAVPWLENQYRNHWKTNNTSENYYDYWGSYWDRVHNAKR